MSIWNKIFKKNTKPKKQSKRNFEGAAKSRRTARWYTPRNDVNAANDASLPTLRDRSRDLRRNNPYFARAIMGIANNTIGTGIRTQIRGEGNRVLQAETMWRQWVESKEFDYQSKMSWYSIQNLAAQAVVESGEVLLRRRIDRSRQFPVSYQVLEADFIDTTQTDVRLPNGNFIIQGVEFNSDGQVVAYHLYRRHPGSVVSYPDRSFLSDRVPASEVHHIYRTDRPGQARGVPWGSPCIIRVKDLDDYEDAQLVRQKIAACFSIFVKDINGDIEDDGDCDLGEKIEPGLIELLPSGKEVQAFDPPSVDNYSEYLTSNLRAIASGFGVTYEMLTNDLSSTNFSSGRMGHLEFQRNIQAWRNNIFIPLLIEPVVQDFRDYAELMGVSTEGLSFVHVPPRREMIDPTKEVPAIRDSIRSGLTSLSDEIMAQGRDPEEHLSQIERDNAQLDRLGIVLDSDPRMTGRTGNLQDTVELDNEENSSTLQQ